MRRGRFRGFRAHLRWDRGTRRSIPPALIEVAGTARSVVVNRLGLSGIETGRLIEVVGEEFLCGLF